MAKRSSNRNLSETIKLIYDAALDWRAWPAALDDLADLLNARTAQLGTYHAKTHRLDMVMPRIAPEYARSFIEYWAPRNTVWQQSGAVAVGEIMQPEMFVPGGAWNRTDFFNEWYRPQRLDSMMGTNLLVEGPVSTVLSVSRKEQFSQRQIELLKLLIPHLQRAAQLHLRLALLDDQQACSVNVFDKLRQGVLLVDEACQIYFANTAAERILACGSGLRSEGGVVSAETTAETALLVDAITSSVQTAFRGAASSSRRIRISRKDGRRALTVLAFPLRPQAPWTRRYRPAAMLFVNDPERKIALHGEHLRKEFGLTSAETTLALEIVAGSGLQAAADRMNVTLNTARTHLTHVFQKTKTHRQAQLVRLIMQSDNGLEE